LLVREEAEVTHVAHPTVPVVVTVPPVNGELNTILVTVPEPGGAAHVPSPRQKVDALALVPLFKFVTGRFPETSVAKLTAAKLGAPPALPCRTVVVLPRELSTVTACEVFPRTKAFAVSDEPVTQVVQPMLPVVVMVPPVSGELAVMLVTVPEPAGVAQMPSPRQKVLADAALPLFRCDTPRLPVTPPFDADARLITGMSAETRARKEGNAAAPLLGPA